MSEHEDLWPGPRRAPEGAGQPQPSVEPGVTPTSPGSSDAVSASPDAGPAGLRAPQETSDERFAPVGARASVVTPEQAATPPATPSSAEQPSSTATGTSAEQATSPVSRSQARAGSSDQPADRRGVSRPVLIWSIVGGVVLVAVAAAAYLLLGDDDQAAAPTPIPTVTNTLPAPTATTEPVARGEGSALFTALPGVVRQYVLTSLTPGDLAAHADAVETYDLAYQGDLDGAAVSYVVDVTQLATTEQATAAAEALTTTLAPASSTGEVLVLDAPVGTFTLFGEDGLASETGHAVWTNGTVVLHASGPALDIRNFYLAFGL